MANERIGDQALELETFRGLKARGHLDEEVGIEAPIRNAEAQESGGLVVRRERDETFGRLAPQGCRGIEGELEAHEEERGLPGGAPLSVLFADRRVGGDDRRDAVGLPPLDLARERG